MKTNKDKIKIIAIRMLDRITLACCIAGVTFGRHVGLTSAKAGSSFLAVFEVKSVK